MIAPALIPMRPGDRVKTDRRGARKLAELLRADLLTAVHPPTIDQEAVRDLCRAREDAVADRTRARHRLSKLLLRRGIAYDGRNWTLRHRRWLLTLRFEHPAAQATFDDYLRALEGVEERLRTLEQELAACAASDDYREAVGLLRCFRGVDTVTALTVLAELGDVTRFGSARQLMSYLGLTPSEHSSGARQRRGPITKTGNSHVRRILVESAWHYCHPPRVGAVLRKRREGQPGWAVVLADRAQARLHRRHRRLAAHGKPSVVANVAVARELAGCCGGCAVHPCGSGARRRQPAMLAALPRGRRRRIRGPRLHAPLESPPHRSRDRAAHLCRAPRLRLRAAPHRLGARACPFHRLRRAQTLRAEPPRPVAPRHQAPAALRAPRARRPAAYRREEAGPHPRRRRAPRARPLRRDPAHPRPRLPAHRVDDHSRYAYVAVLPDERGPSCAAFLEQALAAFGRRGVRGRGVLTDNAKAYTVSRDFRRMAAAAGVELRHTRPYRPQTKWDEGRSPPRGGYSSTNRCGLGRPKMRLRRSQR